MTNNPSNRNPARDRPARIRSLRRVLPRPHRPGIPAAASALVSAGWRWRRRSAALCGRRHLLTARDEGRVRELPLAGGNSGSMRGYLVVPGKVRFPPCLVHREPGLTIRRGCGAPRAVEVSSPSRPTPVAVGGIQQRRTTAASSGSLDQAKLRADC